LLKLEDLERIFDQKNLLRKKSGKN
jgi:hypothetical protein